MFIAIASMAETSRNNQRWLGGSAWLQQIIECLSAVPGRLPLARTGAECLEFLAAVDIAEISFWCRVCESGIATSPKAYQ